MHNRHSAPIARKTKKDTKCISAQDQSAFAPRAIERRHRFPPELSQSPSLGRLETRAHVFPGKPARLGLLAQLGKQSPCNWNYGAKAVSQCISQSRARPGQVPLSSGEHSAGTQLAPLAWLWALEVQLCFCLAFSWFFSIPIFKAHGEKGIFSCLLLMKPLSSELASSMCSGHAPPEHVSAALAQHHS